MYDFIVIGGGICGLQIAAQCSKLGTVLVLEKQTKLGGRARVVEKDGFLLDYGPHPVRYGPKSAIAKTARECDLDVNFIYPDISYVYMADGTRHVFPSGLKGYLKTKMIPRLKTISTFLKIYRKLKKDPEHMYNTSIKQFLDDNNVDERIRQFFLVGSASMQVNPFIDRSSIGELFENTMQVIKHKSVYYPDGGWSVFYDGFTNFIKRNNGKIELKKEVLEIIVDDGKVRGVRTEDGVIEAKNVVNTVPIQNLFDILDPKLASDEFVRKCENQRPTAGICIDFCLNTKLTDELLVFFEDPPAFGLIPSNLSPNVAPIGKSLMSFFIPTNVSTIKDNDKRTDEFDRFRETITSAYPELESHIEFERPLFLEMVDGIEIAVDQHRLNRVKPDELEIDGLYLTGDSIGGEGTGGDVGHTSVRECFQKIKRNLSSNME